MGLSVKRYIIAVSGGVDSVVLLDTLVRQGYDELVVAHFDHGIRPESDADARFVKGLAEKYNLPFETKREELGGKASEELARTKRYEFLENIAKKHDALIVTAHHADDVIETIAINLSRGTGWRGLAVLDNPLVVRPLLSMTKADIREYALKNDLEWVEDETNRSDVYLRNQLRFCINAGLADSSRKKVIELWRIQRQLKQSIDEETNNLLLIQPPYSRYFFTHIDGVSAKELLWAVLARQKLSLTGPARQRLLHAIKTAKPGSAFEAGAGIVVRFTPSTFIVETP